MGRQVVFAAVIAAVAVATGLASAAEPLEASFLNPPPGYGEVPFWWWTGEKLDKERIAWQLEELHRMGVAGTQVNYSHLMSSGWKTAPVEPAIFSDAWWDVFGFAAEKSAALGMGIGLSCYTLDWPGRNNLFADLGICAPDTCARSLGPDGRGIAKPAVRRGTLDPLNPESARRVIDRFFRPFWERVPERGRAALNYFFQDELRLCGGWLWSEDFPEEFLRRKGYDVVPKLDLLFAKSVTGEVARVRLDYNDVMMDLAEERYFKPIYDWHASRGLIYACDPSSRGHDPAEFGDYMRAISWYTAPGFDTPGASSDPLKCKMGSSIAHLYRRPRVWVEGYHSLGWQASPETLFGASARNFAYGANLLNLHGLYYSTYGGWWEWAPPCYHFRQPYWMCFGAMLRYFERLSYLLTRGDHVCDVAILTPQAPCVVDPKRAYKSSVPLARALVTKLAENGCTDCDFVDARSLAAAKVERDEFGTVLAVAGERYRAIILPDMFVMRESSKAKLGEFAAAGGRVIDAKGADDVRLPLVPRPDVEGPPGLKCHHRRTATHDIYFLTDWNFTDPIRLRTQGELEFWDAWTGKAIAAPRRGEPVLAVVKRKAKGGDVVIRPLAAGEVRTIAIDGSWRMTLKPTLDNRWGDFRMPAAKETIGAEVRTMRWVEGNRDEVLGYGPQFFVDGNESSPYEFSWRYGVFGKPANQDKHHGLNERVGDTFLIMGPYSAASYYDMRPKPSETNLVSAFTTFVYAPFDLNARIDGETERPFAVCGETRYAEPVLESLTVGGAERRPGETVSLKAGYTPVSLRYRGCGRAALVFSDVTDGRSYAWPEPLPLAMKWNSVGGRLEYDPYGGKHRKGTFVASVPAGTVDAKVDVYGKLLRKEIKDGKLTVEVEFRPGYVGGNAFKGEIKLKVEPYEAELGDWAQVEGLRCYSGGALYEKTVTLRPEDVAMKGRKLLDLGRVGSCAAVRVNGGEEHVRVAPPWTVDVTDELRAGENRLSVTVYNTLNNHYQTIPTRYKVPTENCPSGLLGPVTLNLER